MLIDLHNHTWPRSHDSILEPRDLAHRARAAGLDAICLSEHDNIWPQEEVDRLCADTDFLILPGAEVSTEHGHILAFGITQYAFGMHKIDRLARHVHGNAGVLVAAHPYRRQMPWSANPQDWETAIQQAALNPAYPYCVALEGLNGRGSEQENRFSRDLLRYLGLPETAGTDSHAVHDIGKVATYFESDAIHDLRDLIRELKRGRFCAVDLSTGREIAVPLLPER